MCIRDSEHSGVAVRNGAAFDRLELRRALAKPLQRLIDGFVGDSSRWTRCRQRAEIARVERGHGLHRRRELQRLSRVPLDVLDVRRIDRLDAALLQRLFDRTRDQPVHHVVEDLVLEALLDDRGGDFPWSEPRNLRLLRIVLSDLVDLRVDDVAGDLDGERLLRFADVGEFGFHEEVRKEGLEPPYPFGYHILSLARLPVPPLSRAFQTNRWSGLIPRPTAFRSDASGSAAPASPVPGGWRP